jgi:hypothetical protein
MLRLTADEWLSCADPHLLLKFLETGGRGTVSGRKLRLFGCACCRRIWHLLDAGGRQAIAALERHADGRLGRRRAERAFRGAVVSYLLGPRDGPAHAAAAAVHYTTAPRRAYLAALGGTWAGRALAPQSWAAEHAVQCALLRDIAGNPFRPVVQDARYSRPDVRALARSAYRRRLPDGSLDPARLAILADRLEDSGCADSGALAHLRGPGPHVRGCHVLDLILAASRPSHDRTRPRCSDSPLAPTIRS